MSTEELLPRQQMNVNHSLSSIKHTAVCTVKVEHQSGVTKSKVIVEWRGN